MKFYFNYTLEKINYEIHADISYCSSNGVDYIDIMEVYIGKDYDKNVVNNLDDEMIEEFEDQANEIFLSEPRSL